MLQNEVCNGPGSCIFRSQMVNPGSGAFASGAVSHSAYTGPDFQVARVGFCATTAGTATIRWELAPTAPITRTSQIRASNNTVVNDPSLYIDYVVNIIVPTDTPTPTNTATPTATHTPTDTPTNTPTDLSVNTPTETLTNTPTKTKTYTRTPTNTRTYTPTRTATNTYTGTPTATATSTPTSTPTCVLISDPLYLHYTDRDPVNDGYLMDSSIPPSANVQLPNSIVWYSPVYTDATFNGGDYKLEIDIVTCAWRNADAISYALEYTDPNGANPTPIGTPITRYYLSKFCYPPISDTVALASSQGPLRLQNKRLRMRATWINGSPSIAVGPATYLSSPPHILNPCNPTSTPTNSPTLTATATPGLVGHVTWQGRPTQPNTLQQLPITLTLKSLDGATERNYPAQTTDATGFFTVSVAGLASGTYNWRVKGPWVGPGNTTPGFLANAGTMDLAGSGIVQAEMGSMRAGDATNDNIVNASDFIALKLSYGKTVGDPGYDSRADFDGNTVVNVSDFILLKNNYGSAGAPPIGPTGNVLPRHESSLFSPFRMGPVGATGLWRVLQS